MELYSFAYYTYKQQRSKQNNRLDAKLSDEREEKHLPVTDSMEEFFCGKRSM